MRPLSTLLLICGMLALASAETLGQDEAREPLLVEDFEGFENGAVPHTWNYLRDRSLRPITEEVMNENEWFRVIEEDGRRFVRAFTRGEAIRIILPTSEQLDWNLQTHPRLRWDWRVLEAPEGANERASSRNDTPAAVYVTFSVNFFGIPRSIKYTYSASLPVGSVVSFTGLKVLVVASGPDSFGQWLREERNVAADYRSVFGGDPPDEPLSVALWSDSDSVGGTSRADFDEIVLLPPDDA